MYEHEIHEEERQPETLAWHETLELHELVAFQTNGIFKLKKSVCHITDPKLKELYIYSIGALEKNVMELLQFFPKAPVFQGQQMREDNGFYAGDLLGLAKTSVRNYAIAITETATPQVRTVLTKQIQDAIKWHAQVYNFMYKRGLYPSYNLQQLLLNDYKNAQEVIKMRY